MEKSVASSPSWVAQAKEEQEAPVAVAVWFHSRWDPSVAGYEARAQPRSENGKQACGGGARAL